MKFTIDSLDGRYTEIEANSEHYWLVTRYRHNGQKDGTNPTSSYAPADVLKVVPAALSSEFHAYLEAVATTSIADDLATAIGRWARGERTETKDGIVVALRKVNAAQLAFNTLVALRACVAIDLAEDERLADDGRGR